MHGQACIFRHEHRSLNQVHRRYYTSHLCVLEHLFESRPSEQARRAFVHKYAPETARLPIFAQIHAHSELSTAAQDCNAASTEVVESADSEELSPDEQLKAIFLRLAAEEQGNLSMIRKSPQASP